ncbi:hypothetical protein [Nocardia sp. CA-120079]|uniref:hypothetical protein n=1 Tax=Nocardia sp. CA-120079 TaxID=3239974 RepID=UPI003D9807E5
MLVVLVVFCSGIAFAREIFVLVGGRFPGASEGFVLVLVFVCVRIRFTLPVGEKRRALL